MGRVAPAQSGGHHRRFAAVPVPTPVPPAQDPIAPLFDAAVQLLQAGRWADSAAAWQRLLAARPGHADGWYNLAYVQQRLRQFEAALASYQRALDLRVQGPEEVHLNRAVLLAEHLGREAEAATELRTALALQPRYLPAWLNLGKVMEELGERDAARHAYEQALALQPGHALALVRLADVQPLAGPDDPLITRLQQALARPGQLAAQRADLGFGLGKALDAVGRYDDAFAAYTQANLDSRQSAGPNAPRYDPAAQERLIDGLIAAFPLPTPGEAPPPLPAPGAPAGPIFICGMFRSGSSLVEQILASHPQVCLGGELDLLPALVAQHLGPAHPGGAPVPAALRDTLRQGYLQGVAERFGPGGPPGRLTDKRVDNFLRIGLIRQLFPHAPIVHTRRHPLDNSLALYFLHLSHAMPHAQSLPDIAHWYAQYQRLMAHWRALCGPALLDVDYDRLVADPQPVVARLLAHCGLPWDDACLRPHQARTVVKTPSAWQVRQPLYQRSSGRWRHYQHHLAPLLIDGGPLGPVLARWEAEQG